MGLYDQGLAPSQNQIRQIMKGRKWWKPYQLQAELFKINKKRKSESTITRDLRRMRDVENRYRKNDSWDYRLIQEKG